MKKIFGTMIMALSLVAMVSCSSDKKKAEDAINDAHNEAKEYMNDVNERAGEYMDKVNEQAAEYAAEYGY